MSEVTPGSPSEEPPGDRRGFLSSLSWLFMGTGLAAGYGGCAAMGGRYLFPANGTTKAWLFVARADELKSGDAMSYRTPLGQSVVVARQKETGAIEDFIALSSTCPHLGCQVHWQSQHERFFCPCHNGAFDRVGQPIEGPPAEAGQTLPQYPLELRDGLLYIEVPTEGLASADVPTQLRRLGEEEQRSGPGEDPCLSPRRDDDPRGQARTGELA